MLLLSSLLLSGLSAYGALIPRRVAADQHIKIVRYDPNNVVMVQARYGYQTQIVFAPQETVQAVSLGDSLAWQAVPIRNHLFIKPMAASHTNMTVLTNANSYSFQLDATQAKVVPTYKLQFVYPDGGYNAAGHANAVGTFDPSQLNWKYTFTGDRALAPIEAFDNGQFTYFKFKQGGLSRLPALFIVGKGQQETLVNYRVQGDYVIIHSVAEQFTLRNGRYVTRVYNDDAIGDWAQIK